MGGIEYWQGAIVGCGRPEIAISVTEGQSHDEARGGRSLTGVHGSVTGIQNKRVQCNWEDGNEWAQNCAGAWLHSVLECMVYSWAWDCDYKINDQPVQE